MRLTFALALAALPVLTAGSAEARNFYCVDEARAIGAEQERRLNPPRPNDTLAMAYDFWFHNGEFAYSIAGDGYQTKGMRVLGRKAGAIEYGDGRRRWSVAPEGAITVKIRGPGIRGTAEGYRCVWVGAAAGTRPDRSTSTG